MVVVEHILLLVGHYLKEWVDLVVVDHEMAIDLVVVEIELQELIHLHLNKEKVVDNHQLVDLEVLVVEAVLVMLVLVVVAEIWVMKELVMVVRVLHPQLMESL